MNAKVTEQKIIRVLENNKNCTYSTTVYAVDVDNMNGKTELSNWIND
jgi:hypothetical protein